MHGPAQPMLDLRQQESRRAAGSDAEDGIVASVARGAECSDRLEGDGRHRDARLLCAAREVARRADEGRAKRMVESRDEGRGSKDEERTTNVARFAWAVLAYNLAVI